MSGVENAGASARDIETIYRKRFRAFVLTVTALVGDDDVGST
jgi:hypothetical protein